MDSVSGHKYTGANNCVVCGHNAPLRLLLAVQVCVIPLNSSLVFCGYSLHRQPQQVGLAGLLTTSIPVYCNLKYTSL